MLGKSNFCQDFLRQKTSGRDLSVHVLTNKSEKVAVGYVEGLSAGLSPTQRPRPTDGPPTHLLRPTAPGLTWLENGEEIFSETCIGNMQMTWTLNCSKAATCSNWPSAATCTQRRLPSLVPCFLTWLTVAFKRTAHWTIVAIVNFVLSSCRWQILVETLSQVVALANTSWDSCFHCPRPCPRQP